MSLILHLHPLSSFCQKVLMALYETGTRFEARMVNLGNAEARAAYLKLSPFGKIPALEDTARGRAVTESTIIIEYLQQHRPGRLTLIPREADAALDARLWDRILDHYVHYPMQRVVADLLRPEATRDPTGIEEARTTIRTAYDLIEARLAEVPHPGGPAFTIADCAAAPALFYAQAVEPFATTHPKIAAYFDALVQRPSFARILGEAKPFLEYFPLKDALPARFTA
jgi:glutathione S-transferase